MPAPLRVDCVTEQDGEATIRQFLCQCGHTLVGVEDPAVTVFAGVDTLVCDDCGREWNAAWHGMRFCTTAPTPTNERPVRSDYFAEDVTDE